MSDSPLNGFTQAQLDYLGEVNSKVLFANTTVTVAVAGMMLFMWLYGLSVYLDTPKSQRHGRLGYLALGMLICLLFGTAASVDMYVMYRNLWATTDASGRTYLEVAEGSDSGWNKRVSLASAYCGLLVGDALLFYRCFIIWKGSRWVIWIPGLIYGGAIGLAVKVVSRAPGDNLKLSSQHIYASFTFLQTGFNSIITFLICFKLFSVRRRMAGVFQEGHSRIYDRVSILLIESALPPALLGFAYAIAYVWREPVSFEGVLRRDVAVVILPLFWFASAALSPQLIIFRVTVGRSFSHSAEFESTQTIRFAPRSDSEGTLSTRAGPILGDHGPSGVGGRSDRSSLNAVVLKSTTYSIA